MEQYANRNGNSSVSAFEIGDTWIRVQFTDGSTYRYSYGIAGRENVENMKRLARAGSGLNSYIMSHVRQLYDK